MNGQQLTGFQGPPVDMSGDGAPNTNFSFVGRDVLGYSLGYYPNDYQPIGGTGAAAFNNSYQPTTTGLGADLFNGNIGTATYAIGGINNNDAVSGFTGYVYRYDQLNRLTGMDSKQIQPYESATTWSNTSLAGPVSQRLSYNGNGNMLTNTSTALSNLQYNYHRDANGYLLNNKLRQVGNLDNQGVDNYGYDAIGNLVSDPSQSLSRINWTVYGKMASISKGSVSGLQFGYDAGGNRITKVSQTSSGTTTTHYVRDAQGNVLAVYQYKANGSGVLTEGDWLEQHLYGSSRLGMVAPHVSILPAQKLGSDAYVSSTDGVENAGNHQYELTNHLGNVMATINDILTPGDAFGDKSGHFTLADNLATQLMGQDYYPFGMLMAGRSYIAPGSLNYRYGFNGKEKDDEVKGSGNEIDYGMRVYDPRIGKFFSVDPLTKKYPGLTPYQYASNTPIQAVDLDGLEGVQANRVQGKVGETFVRTQLKLSNEYTVYEQVATRPVGTSASSNTINDFLVYDEVEKDFIRIEVKTGNSRIRTNQTSTENSISQGELQEWRSETTGYKAGVVRTGRSFKVSGSVTARINNKTGDLIVENKIANPNSNGVMDRLNSLENILKARTSGATIRQIVKDFKGEDFSSLDLGNESEYSPVPASRMSIQRVVPEAKPIDELIPEIPTEPPIPPAGEIIP